MPYLSRLCPRCGFVEAFPAGTQEIESCAECGALTLRARVARATTGAEPLSLDVETVIAIAGCARRTAECYLSATAASHRPMPAHVLGALARAHLDRGGDPADVSAWAIGLRRRFEEARREKIEETVVSV